MPSQLNLVSINGVRALSSAWIALFHTWMVWISVVPETLASEMAHRFPLMELQAQGPVIVDVFFVLTPVLLVYQLLPQLMNTKPTAPSCWSVIIRYYRRRAYSVLPSYLLALALSIVMAYAARGGVGAAPAIQWGRWVRDCPRKVHLNLLAMNNGGMFPTPGCGLAFWSMAVTIQAYILLPLLLWALRPRKPGFDRRFVLALATLGAGSLALRMRVVHAARIELPVGYTFMDDIAAQRFLRYGKIYFPSVFRLPAVAAGAALGLLLRRPGALAWIQSRRLAVGATALALQAGVLSTMYADWHGAWLPVWPRTSSFLFASLLFTGGALPAAAIAVTLLALVTASDPIHAAVGRLFSTPVFVTLGQLSPGLYFFHIPALFCFMAALERWDAARWAGLFATSPGAALAVMDAGCLVAGLGAARLFQTVTAPLEGRKG